MRMPSLRSLDEISGFVADLDDQGCTRPRRIASCAGEANLRISMMRVRTPLDYIDRLIAFTSLIDFVVIGRRVWCL